jgi:hypothetical protein
MATVPIEVQNNSISVKAAVNGQDVDFVVDTGDAVGPVFNSDDAAKLNLPDNGPINVSGAGGAVQIYATQATIGLGGLQFENEPGAVDSNLQGPSLLGLPFFIKQGGVLAFDFANNTMTVGSQHVAKHHRRIAELLEEWTHVGDAEVVTSLASDG